jgi:two-component system chemotaxis sensor kinase CheA
MTKQEEEFLKRLRATFKVEAEEHLRAMSSGLLELEKKLPREKKAEHIEVIFRHSHSLKGAARAVNLTEIEYICQSLESFFAAWKRGDINPVPEYFDTLHRALDLIGKVISAADGEPVAVDKTQFLTLTRELHDLGIGGQEGRVQPGGGPSQSQPVTPPVSIPEPRSSRRDEAHLSEETIPSLVTSAVPIQSHEARLERMVVSTPEVPSVVTDKADLSPTVRMSTAKLDQLLLEAEEMLSVKLTTAQRAADLRNLQALFERWPKEWARIQPRVRELRNVPGHADVLEFLDWNFGHFKLLEGKIQAITKAAAQDQSGIGRRVEDLLADTKQLLLLPFSTLLDLFPKLVRDLSRELGKEVKLTIRGGEVEMDKRILEEIKDPLIHLVRNCIDHGVEQPELRAQQNKLSRATITLAVSRLDGNQVEILVSDDGAGIDLLKVKTAALKHGLISAADAGQLSDQQALALIFQSEVSTSPIITEISGRGLGLAIVREKTEKLGGHVSAESHLHAGAMFRIILPVTLSTFRGILVRASNQIFVLPISQVQRVARIKAEAIKTVENRETMVLNGHAVSLARLAGVLALPRAGKQTPASEFLSVVVLGAADERIAFVVDEVLHEEEVLVKSLAKPLSRVRNISGATILGSGKVVPILNVTDLMKSARKTGLTPPLAEAGEVETKTETKRKRILVAEDSITSRMLLKNILESAGHEVKTAVDGVEALTELRTSDFDLVVSDIEMPRMNGFDLITQIRSDRKLAHKPVVLVTALASREDRERGIDVGANAYIVKGSFEQSNLLEAIRRLV